MKKYLLFLAFILFIFTIQNINAQVRIDGVFFDWTTGMQLDVAPNAELTFAEGDEMSPARGGTDPSYMADLDIEDVYATDDADFIYVRVKMNSVANVMNIASDTSYHGGAAIAAYISVDPGAGDTTGLTWGWWGNGYDFFVQVYPSDSLAESTTRYQQFLWEHKQTGNGWDYEHASETIGSTVAWNASSNDVEFSIPKKLLFNPRYLPGFEYPDSVSIMIYAGENFGPWRADYASMPSIAGYKLAVKKPGPIAVDGVFFDWEASTQIDVLPNAEEKTFAEGDDTDPVRGSTDPSYFTDLDIEDVYATTDDDFVYLRVKMNSAANVMNIANDTSYHGGAAIAAYISVDPGAGDTTGLTWGWWGNGYDYFVQVYPADTLTEQMTGYQQALWEHKQTGNGWDYEIADTLRGVWAVWNAGNNEVECAVPKALLFNPRYMSNFVVPDSIAIMIYAGENFGPWRADYASMPGIAGYKVKVGTSTGIADESNTVPEKYLLKQNYPNPFNPSTKISFSLPQEGLVKVKVYNLIGQEISTLMNETKPVGNYSVSFDASSLTSGIYFYSLETDNFKQVRKMLLLK